MQGEIEPTCGEIEMNMRGGGEEAVDLPQSQPDVWAKLGGSQTGGPNVGGGGSQRMGPDGRQGWGQTLARARWGRG